MERQYKGECAKCGAKRYDDQIGLEDTPEDYVEKLVQVFRKVRRVLHPTGTFWLNIGDSYAKTAKGNPGTGLSGYGRKSGKKEHRYGKKVKGLPQKSRLGIPHQVVFALQTDGWIWRDEIVWSKENPLPSSVMDRTCCAHEFFFMLTKQPRYFYDMEAIKEPAKVGGAKTGVRSKSLIDGSAYAPGATGKANQWSDPDRIWGSMKRHKRSVWTVATRGYKAAHFAVFSEELIRPCILAGTSEKGCCPECLAPYERVLQQVNPLAKTKGRHDAQAKKNKKQGRLSVQPPELQGMEDLGQYETIGWKETCSCDAGPPVPCTVMDPFGGACTTGVAAQSYGRRFVGIELNPKYVELSKNRIVDDEILLAAANLRNVEVIEWKPKKRKRVRL